MTIHNAFLAVDPISVTLDCVALIGSAWLAFLSFSKKFKPKRWAKYLCFATGLIGFLLYSLKFMRDMHWLALGKNFDTYYFFLSGCLVGWLLAVCFFGEVWVRSSQAESSIEVNDGGPSEGRSP